MLCCVAHAQELRCDQEMLLQVLTDVDPITRSSMMDRLFVPVNNVVGWLCVSVPRE